MPLAAVMAMVPPGGENDSIAPDPHDPQVIYGGRVDRLDLRTQQTQAVNPAFAHPGEHRAIWTLPLLFSYRDPRVLYFADERLYRTEDGGETWTKLPREFGEVANHASAPSASSTTARSLNGRTSWPTTW